ASGTQSGILWEATGDYNAGSSPGTLHAFDASDLSTELWNSDIDPANDSLPPVMKFVGPTVANGRVYVPPGANAIVVYGLRNDPGPIAPAVSSVVNAASYDQDGVSPGELISIFGERLGAATPSNLELDANGRVTQSLGDTRVLFDGVPAPVVY